MDVYRVTKGSRRAARRRLRQTSDPLTLVERISPIEPREIRTEKVPFPRCIPLSGVVVLPDDLHGYDRALALAHELGHLFDSVSLTGTDRARFMHALGGPARPWHDPTSTYCGEPAEAFASAYALLSVRGPWRSRLFVNHHWSAENDARVLNTASEVIQEACRRPPLAARISP